MVNQVAPLKYILKNATIIKFDISYTNADGTRKTDTQMEEEKEAQGGGNKKKGPKTIGKGKSNASKIQFLLD